MITAIALTLALTLLIIVLAYAAWQWRFRFDVGRVADVMAANLINEYGDDVGNLSESGVKEFARKKYFEMALSFGLPTRLTDYVADRVATNIMELQGEQPQRVSDAPVIYE